MGLRHVPGTLVRELAHRIHSGGRYRSIEPRDGSVLPGLQSLELLRHRLDLFDLPQDLRGKHVLDIGAWDGWFSFECERCGANVAAVDCIALDTFIEARKLPRFDIVLFFGVLYHLRHPLLLLEKVVELSTDLALIESLTIKPGKRAIPAVTKFHGRDELGGQFVEVDGLGTRSLFVTGNESGYQANCLRPPGLYPGHHEVRVRTRQSARSNPVAFTMLES